jgi:hypothetical protein
MRKVLFFILLFNLMIAAVAQPQLLFSSSSSLDFFEKCLLMTSSLSSPIEKNGIFRRSSLKKANPITKNYTYKIIDSPNKTFGYEIYADKKIMIKQNTIPGRQGNEGFATKKQAEIVAKIVTRKLQNGIMPPTITADELLKAGVK